MGILEDLKKEADSTRLANQQAELRQAELERIYQIGIRPAMLRIHAYLLELVEQLGILSWPVLVSFDFPGIGKLDNLEQTNYHISIDSHKEPKLISLTFACAAPQERRYSITSKSAGSEACQFLTSQKVLYSDWAVRDSNQEVIGTVIQCKIHVWVNLAFKVDKAAEGIRVTMHNVDGPSEKSFFEPYKSIDDQWLDRLGHFILRKNESFGKLPMSEEQRIKLRILVEEQKKNRLLPSCTDNQQEDSAQEGLLLKLRNMLARPKI